MIRIPRTPDYMLGVIDFRGRAIPLIDLKTTLRLKGDEAAPAAPTAPTGKNSVVVIMEIPWAGGNLVLGATVDEVKEVILLRDEDVGDAPELGVDIDLSFVEGVAREGDKLFLVLNAEHILGREELEALAGGGK